MAPTLDPGGSSGPGVALDHPLLSKVHFHPWRPHSLDAEIPPFEWLHSESLRFPWCPLPCLDEKTGLHVKILMSRWGEKSDFPKHLQCSRLCQDFVLSTVGAAQCKG